jgi:hypothetical protein
MRCLWSTRSGIGAELIRRRDGGTASHCAILLPAAAASGLALHGPVVLDAQPWHGVRPHLLADWLQVHTVLCAYDVPLPDPAAAQQSALDKIGWGYDWLRNIGYVLWREMGRTHKVNCEELLLDAWLAGGLTLSDRAPRPSVRMLREIAHACGRPVLFHDLTSEV